MKISDVGIRENEGFIRAQAKVIWEDNDLPEREVWFETEAAFSDAISANPHAFLVGCLMPAMQMREKRIVMDEKICPVLFEGLETVMTLMHAWYGDDWQPIRMEAGVLDTPVFTDRRSRAGYFMSGGIDSLAALRLNRLRYPDTHPAGIKDGLLIHGFDIGGVVKRGAKYHVFERAKAAMTAVARDAGVRLIPVYTNIRHLCDDRDLWLNKFFGAVLAAVAHTFSRSIDYVHVASSYDIPNLAPCGSHPLLDPEYSSFDMRIRHRDIALSRLDKIRIVAGWETAFNNFRVCLANVQDRLNCGKCEKCVRTMAGLVAIDALHKTDAFVEDDLSPELLATYDITRRHRDPFYRELIEPLTTLGRNDLVRVIRRNLGD